MKGISAFTEILPPHQGQGPRTPLFLHCASGSPCVSISISYSLSYSYSYSYYYSHFHSNTPSEFPSRRKLLPTHRSCTRVSVQHHSTVRTLISFPTTTHNNNYIPPRSSFAPLALALAPQSSSPWKGQRITSDSLKTDSNEPRRHVRRTFNANRNRNINHHHHHHHHRYHHRYHHRQSKLVQNSSASLPQCRILIASQGRDNVNHDKERIPSTDIPSSSSSSSSFPFSYNSTSFSLSASAILPEVDAHRGGVKILSPAPNRRCIESAILIRAPIDVVLAVLTDYDHLAEFIPNLALSRIRPHPHGGVRVEQCGRQKILGFEFQASVVMDMNAKCLPDIRDDATGKVLAQQRVLDFHMVQSRDFARFNGLWKLIQSVQSEYTLLYYQVEIQPRGLIPIRAIEWRIKEDLPGNLTAVKKRTESTAHTNIIRPSRALSRRDAAASSTDIIQTSTSSSEEVPPTPNVEKTTTIADMDLRESKPDQQDQHPPTVKVASVAIHSSRSRNPIPVADGREPNMRLSKTSRPSSFSNVSDLNQVLITRPTLNRRIISSSIMIDAPVLAVWKVLTDYNTLAQYIPNLAVSRRRYHPQGGIRIEQRGVKKIFGLFKFEASVIMDMTENFQPNSPIQQLYFDIVESNDFVFFKGVWTLEEGPYGVRTKLSYSVEVQPKGLISMAAIEWRLKDDLPVNLAAIKAKSQSLTVSDYMR